MRIPLVGGRCNGQRVNWAGKDHIFKVPFLSPMSMEPPTTTPDSVVVEDEIYEISSIRVDSKEYFFAKKYGMYDDEAVEMLIKGYRNG